MVRLSLFFIKFAVMNHNRRKISILHKRVADAITDARCRSLLVAVSGGADSTALLCILARVKDRRGWSVECVNCNFHLRGEESDRDSEFVENLCGKLGIKIHRLDFDTHAYLESHKGTSTEMACRELRYREFFRIRESEGFDRIVTAHNSDDDIETMLLAMLRGSGTRGLSGMKTDTGTILRPLLTTNREEIEAYLQAIGQDYMTDSSNLTSDYRRNFLRREVLPLLEDRWPGAKKSLRKTIAILKDEASLIEKDIDRIVCDNAIDDNRLDVSTEEITISAIHRFIENFGGNSGMAHEIYTSKNETGSRKWYFKDGATGVLENGILIILKTDSPKSDSITFRWERLEMNPSVYDEIIRNKDRNTIYLPDGEEAYITEGIAAGDRIRPLGMKGSRLVSDILKEGKVPVSERNEFRILKRKKDGEIIWVPGLKRSRHALVAPDSAFVYKVHAHKR